MRRGLILDFGGVITRTLFETHGSTEQALGLAPGTLTWRGPFDRSSDPLWVSMECGVISEREYWRVRAREVGEMLGEDWDGMEILVRRSRGDRPDTVIRPEAEQAIRRAKAAGVRLAILSNELDLFYGADFRGRLSWFQNFDTIVDATYTRILKPDRRAYQLCLEKLRLDAAECVFVDDQRKNVEGARSAGLAALPFDVTNPAASYRQVLAMLQLEESDA